MNLLWSTFNHILWSPLRLSDLFIRLIHNRVLHRTSPISPWLLKCLNWFCNFHPKRSVFVFTGHRASAKFWIQNFQTFPWIYPDFFLIFLDSRSTFCKLFSWYSSSQIWNFWNVSKFWYFFFNLMFLKKDFLI